MCQGRFGLRIRENFYLERVKQCPGNGGDPIPGNVQIPHGGGFVPIQGIIQSVSLLFRFGTAGFLSQHLGMWFGAAGFMLDLMI